MTERVKRKIGRWVAGALGVLLMPLALAQPPHGGHGGGGAHAYGSEPAAMRAGAAILSRAAAASAAARGSA